MLTSLKPGLYGIADTAQGDPVQTAISLAQAGCPTVQLRAKDWTHAAITAAAATIAPKLRALGTCFIINDFPDIALRVKADGVHLGQDDADIDAARSLLGEGRIIGLSTHSLTQAQGATGADYIGFGPVFTTASKTNALASRGIAELREVVSTAPCPVVAIGGIGAGNLHRVVETGVHAWACIAALHAAPTLGDAVRSLSG